MTSNLWMLIATALGQEDTGLDAAMVDPQAMASPGAAIHGPASAEEVEDAFPIIEPAWTPPPLVESFLAMFGFSSPAAGGGAGALASECKCNVALTSDFLGPWADPSLPDNVPSTLGVTIPCGPSLTLHQDDRTVSAAIGATWHGYVEGAWLRRATITRLAGRYRMQVDTPGFTWLLEGTPGGSAVAWCEPNTVAEVDDEFEGGPDGADIVAVVDPLVCALDDEVPVIDILAVYTEQARIDSGGSPTNPADTAAVRVAIANGLARTEEAFVNSRVEARLRFLGIHKIPDEPTGPSCAARAQLFGVATTPGTTLATLIADLDPDLTIGFVPSYVGGDTGCAATVKWTYDAITQTVVSKGLRPAVAVIERHAWHGTTRHELGHAFGLCHEPGAPCSVGLRVPDFAYGFTTQFPTDPTRKYRTIMSKGAGCAGCERINFYAAPSLVWDGATGDLTEVEPPMLGSATPYQLGTPDFPIGQQEPLASDTARALSLHAHALQNYATSTFVNDPRFLSPANNANLTCLPTTPGSCQATYTWAAVPGATGYLLQLGTSPAVANIHSSPVLPASATSYAITLTTAQSVQRLRARLWVRQGTTDWTFVDARHNLADTLVPCADEEPWLVPYTAFDAQGCPTAQPPCLIDASTGELVCEATAATTSTTVAGITAITPRQRLEAPYQFALMGDRTDGTRFCCLYRDQADVVDTVRILGSPLPDYLTFWNLAHNLESFGSCVDSTFARGRQGDDLIWGTGDAEVFDNLFGLQGHDLVAGLEGDDLVHGGPGDDFVGGHGGDDVLLAGPGGGFDDLAGGRGSDVLCSADASDVLRGHALYQSSAAGDLDTLYVSAQNFTPAQTWNAGSGVDVASATCGHAIWSGVDAAACPSSASGLLLTQPPSPCVGEVPP